MEKYSSSTVVKITSYSNFFYDDLALQDKISNLLYKNGALDINIVADYLVNSAYIADFSIKHRWPNFLDVHIKERSPFFQVKENLWYSKEGVLFKSNLHADLKIPFLRIDSALNIKDFNFLKELSDILRKKYISLLGIKITSAGAWTIYLKSGINLLLGSDNLKQRIDNFISYYPFIKENISLNSIIDLRYNSSFSVISYNKRENKK